MEAIKADLLSSFSHSIGATKLSQGNYMNAQHLIIYLYEK